MYLARAWDRGQVVVNCQDPAITQLVSDLTNTPVGQSTQRKRTSRRDGAAMPPLLNCKRGLL